jgi:GT2 family glycosyltransferase
MHGIDYISIKLSKNEGFVGAINKGIKASTSQNICLLNNDTIVTTNWLNKLVRTLNSDNTLGVLGALTVDDYLDKQHMDSHHNLKLHSGLVPASIAYTKNNLGLINDYLETHYFGQHRPIVFVAFLCAVIKREIINKIGLLDPNYAMGLYDDNDYNLSVRKAGYKTNISLDTCIYHRGRSTFSLIQKTEKISVDKLLRTNLNYLNKKWGLNLKNAHIKD